MDRGGVALVLALLLTVSLQHHVVAQPGDDTCSNLYTILQNNLNEFNTTYPAEFGFQPYIFAKPLEVVPCSKSVAFNETRDFSTLDSIIDYFNSFYATLQVAKRSPDPRIPSNYDVVGELSKLFKGNWSTYEDFYNAVIRTVQKLDDGHTRFEVNCPPFAYRLPNPLIFAVEKGEPTVRLAPASFLEDIFINISKVPFDYNPLDFVGAKVVTIEGEDAWKYMLKWSKEFSGVWHSEGQKLNWAFARAKSPSDFNFGQAAADPGAFSMRMVNPYKNTLSITIALKKGGVKKVEMPWIAYAPSFILDQFINSATYYTNLCATQFFFPDPTNPNAAVADAENLPEEEEESSYGVKLSAKIGRSTEAPKGPKPGAFSGQGTTLEDLKAFVSELPGVPSAFTVRESGMEAPPLTLTSGTVVSDEFDLWKVYLLSDNVTAVIVIDTFAPPSLPIRGDALSYFVVNTQKAFYLADKYGKRIIIDLSNNGGGYEALVPWLAELVLGSAVYPSAPTKFTNPWNNLAETDVVFTMRKNNLFPFAYYAYADINGTQFNDTTQDQYFYPIVQLVFGRRGVPGNYSSLFKAPLEPLNEIYYPFKSAFGRKPYILFSNGICFSACGEFATMMNKLFRVPMVSIGGVPGVSMPFGAGGGGITSPSVELAFYYSFDAEVRALPDAPKQFPIQSNLAMKTVNGFLQRPTGVDLSAPMEYIYTGASVKIDYTPENVADVTRQYLDAAKAYWGK